jgi:signal transduction histidine kinase
VQVDLATDAGNGLTLRVQDDGIGIGPVLRAGACGLHGMRERIRDAGGTMAIDSPAGAGTCVTVSIPHPH